MSGTANDQPSNGDDTQQGAEGAQAKGNWGGAVGPDVPAGGIQDAPAEDTHETTDEDRLQGIIVQTQADMGDASADRLAEVLRQRVQEVGLDVGDDRIRALAAEIKDR